MIKYFVISPVEDTNKPQIATAAFRHCSLCNVAVDSMGGPGDGTICNECVTLIKHHRIKIDREDVLKTYNEIKGK